MASTERLPRIEYNRAFLRRFETRGYEFDFMNRFVRDTIFFQDDFERLVIDSTNDWAAAANGTASAAAAILASTAGGAIRLTTGTDLNGDSILARVLDWTGNLNPVISARIKVSSVATTKIEVGFSDSTTGRGVINVLNTPTATSTDGVVAIYDTSATTQYWQLAGVRAGTAWSLATNTSVLPAAATWTWVSVALKRVSLATDDMDAVLYVDGTQLLYKRLGAVSNTVALTPFIYVQARAASASRNLDVDYVSVQADRDTSA